MFTPCDVTRAVFRPEDANDLWAFVVVVGPILPCQGKRCKAVAHDLDGLGIEQVLTAPR